MNSQGGSSTKISCAFLMLATISSGSVDFSILSMTASYSGFFQFGQLRPLGGVLPDRLNRANCEISIEICRLMFIASTPSACWAVRRVAQRDQHRPPVDDLERDVETALLQLLRQILVHWQRKHLPRAARRDHDLCLDRLLRAKAGFLEQGFAFGRIVIVLLLRVTEERVGLLEQ